MSFESLTEVETTSRLTYVVAGKIQLLAVVQGLPPSVLSHVHLWIEQLSTYWLAFLSEQESERIQLRHKLEPFYNLISEGTLHHFCRNPSLQVSDEVPPKVKKKESSR